MYSYFYMRSPPTYSNINNKKLQQHLFMDIIRIKNY